MYNVNLKNIIPSGDLTCLFAKATLDESNLWHRRLGYVNFKTINKLVKGNLVRGLPTKVFTNDNSCVACKKGKQHRASCKSKTVSSIDQPLFRLHMDLFGPTFVKSLSSGPAWLFDIDSLTRTMNYHPVIAENPTNSNADALVDGKEHDDDIQKSVSPDIYFSSSGAQTRKHCDKTKNKDKGWITLRFSVGFGARYGQHLRSVPVAATRDPERPLPNTVQLETAVSTISQEYLLEFTSEYGISENLHPELPGPEERIVDFPEGKVNTGTRPRVAHEVPLLTVTASRVIEMEDPTTATDSSGVPSTIKRVAPEAGQMEKIAAMGPRVIKERHKSGNNGVDTNAPSKVLRRDHADSRPIQTIACRRWVIGNGLRLAVMKCGESTELRQVFVDVVLAGIAKGMSEGLKYEDLKYPMVDQLKSLMDASIDVIIASLHLESDTGDDAPQWIRELRPSSSQLKIPVYPEVRDLKDPWACNEEILLVDAIVANISRAEKKKKCRVVCHTHDVGYTHHARSDGLPVSVPTVAPQGLAILLTDAATQTETSEDMASPRICTGSVLCAPWESSRMHLTS
uniref:Ribonuclease H-like domain-containing protein n=1 Tax=Tanacetum cinerariifolium TaxID=118510 RepID=A0A6L2JXD9_TANCI|nr:ribonuclease H-like domain-containing protein [Tanacetum cinerariifolium]